MVSTNYANDRMVEKSSFDTTIGKASTSKIKRTCFALINSDDLNGRPPDGVAMGVRRKWVNNTVHQSTFDGQIK
jgi:hypothetical protein